MECGNSAMQRFEELCCWERKNDRKSRLVCRVPLCLLLFHTFSLLSCSCALFSVCICV